MNGFNDTCLWRSRVDDLFLVADNFVQLLAVSEHFGKWLFDRAERVPRRRQCFEVWLFLDLCLEGNLTKIYKFGGPLY